MDLSQPPTLDALRPRLQNVLELAGTKIHRLNRSWDPDRGTPVFTVGGRYTTRGWTEWTRGFQYGCALLHFDATGDTDSLAIGRRGTLDHMTPHLSHTGVHDHGFNTISTYGNLRRLIREGRVEADPAETRLCETALKVSGAVQAARWTSACDQDGDRCLGYIYSFNGPHSLFADTIRSLRVLCVAWQQGHVLMGENDQVIDLLRRACRHAETTARFNVYYGEARDAYDVPGEAGRVAHESIFNINDGRYRCPSTQQGYSPFSTWTRGLAWVLCGYAEQLEFLRLPAVVEALGSAETQRLTALYRQAATACAQWYIDHSFRDGMVYWDSGAPGIPADPGYGTATSDPANDCEPIDSSAAAIAAQGFLRLGRFLRGAGEGEQAARFEGAARVLASTLFAAPYLATSPDHQGLILHSIYHRPNGWDHVPASRRIPCGESSLWGDYHALELAVLLQRHLDNAPHITFFDGEG